MGLGFKALWWMFLIMVFFFCCSSTLWMIAFNQGELENQQVVTGQDYGHEDVAKLVFAGNVDQLRMTQGQHPDGFSNGAGGFDYSTYCGDTLYSPVAGSAVVTYNGFDGVYPDNTMITIVGKAGEANLLHGNFDAPVGTVVIGGVTPIGTNASRGFSTGCHSHINFKPANIQITQSKNNPSGKGEFRNYKIAVSHYVPSQGGVNCQHPCNQMASGELVSDWTFPRNGIMAMACPPELPFGTRIMLSGQVYECKDRGGYIQARTVGEYDPAFKNTATENYFWIDILDASGSGVGYAYGEKTLDWTFVK